MKAKELMIGDWVQGFFPDIYSQIGQTTWNGSVIIFTRNGVEIDLNEEDVQPVPLTAEILEKNNCEEYRGGLFNLQDPSLGLSLESDGFVIGQDYGERGGFEGFIEIKYVHELQHALRLCGLNELADNFKV